MMRMLDGACMYLLDDLVAVNAPHAPGVLAVRDVTKAWEGILSSAFARHGVKCARDGWPQMF